MFTHFYLCEGKPYGVSTNLTGLDFVHFSQCKLMFFLLDLASFTLIRGRFPATVFLCFVGQFTHCARSSSLLSDYEQKFVLFSDYKSEFVNVLLHEFLFATLNGEILVVFLKDDFYLAVLALFKPHLSSLRNTV